MNKKILIILVSLLSACCAKAQWVVTDPTNFAQGIVNTINQIAQTSTTAKNTLDNFSQTVKIFEQGKAYYDALKSVKNLVKDAKKVQQTMLMVGDISEIYVENFKKMLADPYFTQDELEAIAFIFSVIIDETTEILLDIKNVITSNGLSMTDKERMDVIDKVHTAVKDQRDFAIYFARKTISVSYLRAKEDNNMQGIMSLYGDFNDKYW